MIKVYSKANCMQCYYTKKWLDDNNIEYQEIDVIEDETALNRLKEMEYQSLPVVETKKDIWYGFRPDRLEELK